MYELDTRETMKSRVVAQPNHTRNLWKSSPREVTDMDLDASAATHSACRSPCDKVSKDASKMLLSHSAELSNI